MTGRERSREITRKASITKATPATTTASFISTAHQSYDLSAILDAGLRGQQSVAAEFPRATEISPRRLGRIERLRMVWTSSVLSRSRTIN
jgi:hypothetical protein